MRRFFIDKNSIKDNSIIIEGKEAHHIRDVIRLKSGDRFLGLDGDNKTYTLRITKLNDKVLEAEIEKVSSATTDIPNILLACAIPKARKIEYIIEKAVELGVSDIIPMITERTIVKISEKDASAKKKRWEKIALEASKQCGREKLPNIYGPTEFKDALLLTKNLGYNKKIMPCLKEGSKLLKEVLSCEPEKAAVFIGPEGDFTEKEIEYAKADGFALVSLGPLVLKVDTACIFTISAILGSL